MSRAAQTYLLRLFISYAHKDALLRRELETHLSPLERQGLIEIWSDQAIEAGREWEQSISEQLKTADVILLLISSDFLASKFIYDKELKRAMERHEAGEARVIPVFLRPCDWKGEVFGKLQGVPVDAKPITRWEDRDEAFTIVVQAIRKAVTTLGKETDKHNTKDHTRQKNQHSASEMLDITGVKKPALIRKYKFIIIIFLSLSISFGLYLVQSQITSTITSTDVSTHQKPGTSTRPIAPSTPAMPTRPLEPSNSITPAKPTVPLSPNEIDEIQRRIDENIRRSRDTFG